MKNAIDILNEEFAKGNVTEAEYKERKAVLQDSMREDRTTFPFDPSKMKQFMEEHKDEMPVPPFMQKDENGNPKTNFDPTKMKQFMEEHKDEMPVPPFMQKDENGNPKANFDPTKIKQFMEEHKDEMPDFMKNMGQNGISVLDAEFAKGNVNEDEYKQRKEFLEKNVDDSSFDPSKMPEFMAKGGFKHQRAFNILDEEFAKGLISEVEYSRRKSVLEN